MSSSFDLKLSGFQSQSIGHLTPLLSTIPTSATAPSSPKSNVMQAALPVFQDLSNNEGTENTNRGNVSSENLFLQENNSEKTESQLSFVEHVNQMIATNPLSPGISFFSLFAIEFCKLQARVKASKSPFMPKLEQFWRSWHASYAQTVKCFLKNEIDQNDQKTLAESIKKMARLPSLAKQMSISEIKNSLNNEAQVDAILNAYLCDWENYQKLLTKFFAFEGFLEDVPHRPDFDPEKNTRPLSSSKWTIDTANELYRFVAFIKDSMPTFPGDFFQFNPFDLILEKIDLVRQGDFEDLTQIAASWHEMLHCVADNFMDLTHLREAKACKNSILDSAIFWMREIIKTLEFSVLPVADFAYEDTLFYQQRLSNNIICLHSFIMDFEDGINCFEFDDQPVCKLLEKINNKFFNKIIDLRSGLKPLIKMTLICECLNFNLLPFVRRDLKEFSEKLKPLLENILQTLSETQKKHSEKLQGLPLVEMTKKLGMVMVIMHDIQKLQGEKNDWLSDFPPEYLLFISMADEVSVEVDVPA
nr:hypothetical protein [Parachlamydiaceae bacterium]